jgi:hypothetical protein
MAGSWRISLAVLATFFFLMPSASAFNGRVGYWPTPSVGHSCYWPSGSYYYCPPPVTVLRLADTCAAVPTPAPPSQTLEPPLRAPVINSTRSLGGSYDATPAPSAKDRCQVGFWNLSGRDVMLTIGGKTWALAKNRKVTLELQREFSWQADRGPQEVERVPENQSTHEVVVRDRRD